jgi:hypothetical protein
LGNVRLGQARFTKEPIKINISIGKKLNFSMKKVHLLKFPLQMQVAAPSFSNVFE